jgi:hypothetical protein
MRKGDCGSLKPEKLTTLLMNPALRILVVLLAIGTTAQAQVTSGLVAKYYFNGGMATDEVGTNHGVVTGATLTTDRFGNAGMAYAFDGVDDHIDLGDAPAFQMGTSDFSISLWVNYTVAQQGVVFSKRDGATSNYSQYNLSVIANPQFGGVSKNMWSFERCSNSNDRATLVGDISGSWKHVAFVHGHLDSTIIYVDGQVVAYNTDGFTGSFNVAGRPLVLGYHSENSSSFFNGEIDDVRVYNRKLTEGEVDILHNELNPTVDIAPEAAQVHAMSVFPNPTQASIQVNVSKPTMVTIVDVLGQELEAHRIVGAKTLDVSSYAAGIYFIRDMNTGKATKFVKE